MINTTKFHTNLNITHTLNVINNSINTHLNILYMNIRSLRQKLNELELLIGSYPNITHIIILTETWLYDNEIKYYNIPHYNHIANTRPVKRGGGCSIYIHESIKYNTILSKEWSDNNIIGVNILYNSFNFNLFGIYKAPHTDINNFIDIFSTILDKYKNAIYFGDMNINLLNIGKDTNTDEYVNIILSKGNLILNLIDTQSATRVANGIGTIIDHIITNLINLKYNICLSDTPLSDHRYMYTSIENIITNKPTTNTFKILQYDNINSNTFKDVNKSESIDTFITNMQTIITNNTAVITKKKIHQNINNRGVMRAY